MTDPQADPLRSQAEMPHLFFPFDRQIDEAGHPEAAWQSFLKGSLNDIWSEEGDERRLRTDRSLSPF
jgi:hypothetical protein